MKGREVWDMVVSGCAVVAVLLAAMIVVVMPRDMGKPCDGPLTWGTWVTGLGVSAIFVVLAGRALKWW